MKAVLLSQIFPSVFTFLDSSWLQVVEGLPGPLGSGCAPHEALVLVLHRALEAHLPAVRPVPVLVVPAPSPCAGRAGPPVLPPGAPESGDMFLVVCSQVPPLLASSFF